MTQTLKFPDMSPKFKFKAMDILIWCTTPCIIPIVNRLSEFIVCLV